MLLRTELTGMLRPLLSRGPRARWATTAAGHAPPRVPPREYPGAPRIGVAATVLSRSLPRRVLLVRRGKPPGEGAWSLPGGLVDLGEGLGTAALREVEEETRLTPTLASAELPSSSADAPSAAFFVTESVHLDEGRVRFHYVLCHVLCFADDTADPIASDDAAGAAWVDAADVLRGKGPPGSGALLPKTSIVLRAALAIVGDEPQADE